MSSVCLPSRPTSRPRRSWLRNPLGSSRKISNAWSTAWAPGSPGRSPAMRCPSAVTIGWWTAVKASGAGIGVWVSRWGLGGGGEGFGGADRVVAESLDAEQAPVGGEADLPQRGQVGQSLADGEVAGVVDRGLGAQCPSLLVVLLDLGVLVVDVQARGDPVDDHPDAERARRRAVASVDYPPVEDEADLVGAAGVEVVPDDLFEE